MPTPLTSDETLKILDAEGMQRFLQLQNDAVSAVTERFYATHGTSYERFGPSGRQACRDDLAFHLEFLRPVLEFGLLKPMVDYLQWLSSVLASRMIPNEHLAVSLDWLAEFFAEKMNVTDGPVVVAALLAARKQFLETDYRPPIICATETWAEATELEAALLAGRQPEASAIINRCIDDGHSLIDVEIHVIQPALYGIGAKWQTNQVSVAQEHLASAMAQSLMTSALLRYSLPVSTGKRVLLACVAENTHAIGLRMVTDAFQLAGWEVQYLGADVPTPALIKQVIDWKPDLLGLSVSFPHQLKTVRDVISRLNQALGDTRPAIIIGGLAINRFNQLANVVGADTWSPDASSAVDDVKKIIRR